MLTDKEKIEVLKDLIKTRQMAVTQRGNDELVTQAQQWLAELEIGADGWTDVVFPTDNNIVEVKFKDDTISKGYYSCVRNEWFSEIGDDFDFDIVAWRHITTPTK